MNHKDTIVMFKFPGQYHVLQHFVTDLSHAFLTLGYDVETIDMLDAAWTQKLESVIKEKPVSFILSMDGVGIELQIGQESLYDILNIPFFAYMVDHPMYHLHRFTSGVKQLIVSCIDRSHVSFLRRYVKGQYSKVFIPHGAAIHPADNVPLPIRHRKIDILFAGTFADPDQLRTNWTAHGPHVSKLFDNILDAALFENETGLAETAEKVAMECGIDPDYLHQNRFWNLLVYVDYYIRQYRRKRFVTQLSRLPVNIEIYGNGWEMSGIPETSSLSFHPPLDFGDIHQKMGQSKIVASVLPNFPEGGHERIFTTMLHGAVCLSDSNKFMDTVFVPGSDFLSYSWREDNLNDLEQVIKDLDRLQEVADHGREKVLQSHTWKHRAAEILETVAFHKFFFQ